MMNYSFKNAFQKKEMTSRKPPPLPRGWSQHESTKIPGKLYYFNKGTGVTTWDIRDIISSADLPVTGRQRDINSLSVEELETLLRLRKQEDASPSKQKRKLVRETNSLSNKKRKKIVLHFSKEETKPKEDALKTSQLALEKSPIPICKSVDRSSEKSFDSEGSLVLDEDEKRELMKIKSKHKSPKNKSLKNKKGSSPAPTISSPKTEIFSKLNDSPLDLVSQYVPTTAAEESALSLKVDEASKPSTFKFLPKNFSTRYVNYQNDEKLTYTKSLSDRRSKRQVSIFKRSSPVPLSQPQPPQDNPLEVTPDHNVDITPVYGSFDSPELEAGDDSSKFNLKQSIQQQQRQAYVPPPPIRRYEPPALSMQPRDGTDESFESSFNDISYEGERPPTPTLIKELEEEESMEWEPSEMVEVIKETAKVRVIVSKEVESQHDDTSAEKCCEIPASKCLVILDTNIFISSLNTVVKLMDNEKVIVVIPWMVVQELDNLKNSENQKTAVGARAGVRWLNSTLLSSSPKVKTETAAQCRKVSAKFGSKSPDDKILATCFQFKEDGHKVVLVTNDVNLGNKALINHLLYGDSNNILDLVNNKSKVLSSENNLDEEDSNQGIINESVTQLKEYLRDLLEGVLRDEFLTTYGDNIWEKIVSIKPRSSKPFWTLNQLFTLYSKHHMAVFGLNFPRSGKDLKENMASLKNHLDAFNRKEHKSKTEVKVLFAHIIKLVDCIKVKGGMYGDYDGLVSICEEKMQEAISQVEDIGKMHKILTNSEEITSISSQVQEQVQTHFQTIWEIIAAFTRGFAACFQVDCDPPIPAFEPNIKFNSQEEAAKELVSFFRSVSGLNEAMIRAVSDGDEASRNRFHDQLLSFRAGLELDLSYWPVQVKVGILCKKIR